MSEFGDRQNQRGGQRLVKPFPDASQPDDKLLSVRIAARDTPFIVQFLIDIPLRGIPLIWQKLYKYSNWVYISRRR